MSRHSLNLLRANILQMAKKYISNDGWSEDIFNTLATNSNLKYAEMITLFPNGYRSLIYLYLEEINDKMTEESNKINLIRLKTHQRIREIILLRLKIMLKEKILIQKTYFHLLLPQNFKISLKSVYKSVDQIWFLAGDNSTDFNFYSKRVILAKIYSMVIFHFVNNDSLDETTKVLDKQLNMTSKIPKIKNRLKDVAEGLPQLVKIIGNISSIRR